MSSEEATPIIEPSSSNSQTNEQSTSKAETSAGVPVLVGKKYTPPSDGYIRLYIMASDSTEEQFRVKTTAPLGLLKREYCNKVGRRVKDLRFEYDGDVISDTDTPNSMDMINEDTIEVYQDSITSKCF